VSWHAHGIAAGQGASAGDSRFASVSVWPGGLAATPQSPVFYTVSLRSLCLFNFANHILEGASAWESSTYAPLGSVRAKSLPRVFIGVVTGRHEVAFGKSTLVHVGTYKPTNYTALCLTRGLRTQP
jgi:hypothetical protein